ncbi:MAG: adenylate cyclase [Chthoniobacter sp.]|nr:adenylate cyclase [Chthoniobacter sp.]
MLLVALIGLVLMRESRDQPLAGLEQNFTSWLAANTARTGNAAPLAVVEIRDSSLESQHAWPWSPLDFSLFLEDVLQFKPRVVAIEPVLAWNAQQLPADAKVKLPQFEKILHDRLLIAPKIVLGAQLGFSEDPDVIQPLQAVPVLRKVSGSVNAVPEFTMIEQQPKEELRLASAPGFTNVAAAQTPVRTAPMLFRYRGQVVPSFVLQALMLWLSVTPEDVNVEIGKQITVGEGCVVPIDATGAMLVDFKSPYTHVAFEDLLLAATQMQTKTAPLVEPTAIAGKLALLVRVDSAARSVDLTIGRKGTPGELFAAAMATIQNHAFIRRIGLWFDVLIIVVMMLLSWALCRQPRRRAAAIAVIAVVIYAMIGLTIFASYQLALPLALPVGLAAFIALFRAISPKETLVKTPAAG